MIVFVRVAVEVTVVMDEEVEYCAAARKGRIAVVSSERRILKLVRFDECGMDVSGRYLLRSKGTVVIRSDQINVSWICLFLFRRKRI